MRRVDRRWIITANGKTMIAGWSGGTVVLKEDSRTPEECLHAAVEKGWESRFCGVFSMGTKTSDEIEKQIGEDWEPYCVVTRYEP